LCSKSKIKEKEKKYINNDLAVLPSHDMKGEMRQAWFKLYIGGFMMPRTYAAVLYSMRTRWHY